MGMMTALVLEGARKMSLQNMAKPAPDPGQVLIEVRAAGVCGTDLHIFNGLANYNLDCDRRPIPLERQHQILGHEFCGRVEAVGAGVTKCRPGDLVIVDQVLNCYSQGRSPVCEYCETGDSHQCAFGQEFGITGLPGAFAEFTVVPAPNVIPVPPGISELQAALAEPLGCVLHASDRTERSNARYHFEGNRRIRHVLILGAGPSGLLFLQYLRNVRQFDGEILVADLKNAKLELAARLGGDPVDLRNTDLPAYVKRVTRGEGIHYVIEASGSGRALEPISQVARRQATVLLYGAGHADLAPGCLTPFQAMEMNLVTSGGASGGFDADGTPTTYRRSLECVRDGKVNLECLTTHRYHSLADLPQVFSHDSLRDDFIKGALVRT